MSGRRVRQPRTRPGAPRWSQTPGATDDGSGVYSPSRLDPLVRSASAVIGGPAGSRLASARGFWRAATVLVLLSAVTIGLGVTQKQHCRSTGWSSPDQFWHACYSDIPVIFASSGLGTSDRTDLSTALGTGGLGQPPLSGAIMWITSSLITGNDASANRSFFDLTALLLTAALAIGVAAASFTLGRRGWDAAHLAISPVLITAGLISYQVLAIALLAVALFALSRNRALAGGVLLGLAVAAAPQTAVVGIVVTVLALWRSGSYLHHEPGQDPRALAGVTFAGTGLIVWLGLRIILLPGASGQFGDVWSAWRHGSPGYGSLWLVPQLLGASEPGPATSWFGRLVQGLFGWMFSADALNGTITSVFVVLALLIGAGLLLRATVIRVPPLSPTRTSVTTEDDDNGGSPLSSSSVPVGPTPEIPAGNLTDWVVHRVAPASLAALAVVLVTAKALPTQGSLLLLPLIALSGLRWRDHLIWAGTELVYFVGIWLYIAADTTSNRGLPPEFYLVMLLARLAGIAWVGLQGVLVYRASQSWEEAFLDQPAPTGSLRIEEISSTAPAAGSLPHDRDAGAPRQAW